MYGPTHIQSLAIAFNKNTKQPRNNKQSIQNQISSIKSQIRNLTQETSPVIQVRGGVATVAAAQRVTRNRKYAIPVALSSGGATLTVADLVDTLAFDSSVKNFAITKVKVCAYGASSLTAAIKPFVYTNTPSSDTIGGTMTRTVYTNPYTRTASITFDIPDSACKDIDLAAATTNLVTISGVSSGASCMVYLSARYQCHF